MKRFNKVNYITKNLNTGVLIGSVLEGVKESEFELRPYKRIPISYVVPFGLEASSILTSEDTELTTVRFSKVKTGLFYIKPFKYPPPAEISVIGNNIYCKYYPNITVEFVCTLLEYFDGLIKYKFVGINVYDENNNLLYFTKKNYVRLPFIIFNFYKLSPMYAFG